MGAGAGCDLGTDGLMRTGICVRAGDGARSETMVRWRGDVRWFESRVVGTVETRVER